MSRLIKWLGGATFSLAVALALGFGAQQATASNARAVLCEGTCPNQSLCESCCIQHQGDTGECVGTVCFCIG